MVFSPHIARKIAQESARKVKDALAKKELRRQQTNNSSTSHRAPREVQNTRSTVKSTELNRKRVDPNWRTGIADKLYDYNVTRRDGSTVPMRKTEIDPKAAKKEVAKIKRKINKRKYEKWDAMDIFQMPLSKVSKKTNKKKHENIESTFEATQLYTEDSTYLPMGATKHLDHQFNRLSRNTLFDAVNLNTGVKGRGEQSYDSELAKKWRGIGIGLGGAGVLGGGGLAYSGDNTKKRPGTPNYGNYFG